MISLTVRFDSDMQDEQDDDDYVDFVRDDGEIYADMLPLGVPCVDGTRFHILPSGVGQMAVYQGKIVAWRGCEPVYKAEHTKWQGLD